ncbi:hypothetical protein [Roseovarius sp. Pro17]|uniref:SCO family protein n=1 Tax=Roseovarius sp. Pro17 TaxID=3108175 RepID=UPI002D772EAC|nr:hypothetical protein [Roseovarius sp. Pro17]
MTQMQDKTLSKERVRLNRRTIPNVPVVSHDGKEWLFYDDLIRDQTVLVAFMSIGHDRESNCSAKMAEVRRLLDRDPSDQTLFLSITVDPDSDGPLGLASHAGQSGASGFCGPGEAGRWLFLRAAPDDIDLLRAAFYVHRSLSPVPTGPRMITRSDLLRMPRERAVMDCSLGLMRYGNEALDIWGAAPVRASATDISARLSWVRDAGAPRARLRRRGGPFPAIHS